jgi:hypothetical protein
MHATLRVSVLAAALALSLVSSISACTSIHHGKFERTAPLDRVVGVTTSAGKEIVFAERGATVAEDTLYAMGRKGQLRVPADSISRTATRKFSVVRTIALVGVTVFMASAIAVFSSGLDISP